MDSCPIEIGPKNTLNNMYILELYCTCTIDITILKYNEFLRHFRKCCLIIHIVDTNSILNFVFLFIDSVVIHTLYIYVSKLSTFLVKPSNYVYIYVYFKKNLLILSFV